MSTYTDTDYNLSNRVTGNVLTHEGRKGGKFLHGFFKTAHGIVGVYAHDETGPGGPATFLDFSHQGRNYSREFKKFLTRRGIATAARRFAAEKGVK